MPDLGRFRFVSQISTVELPLPNLLLHHHSGVPHISSMTASLRFMTFGNVIKFLANLEIHPHWHINCAPQLTSAWLITVERAPSKRPTETVVEKWEEVHIDDLVNALERERADKVQLEAKIAQLEAKNAQLEEIVREDVCEEMTKQMQAMENV